MVALGSKPGGYELVAELGYGGMATLFLARRDGAHGFARFAAVKVVHPHLAKQDRFRRMFVDEAKISAEVLHPNVVRVEDFGEHDGTFFMAMEYVHGCSLADFLHTLARRHNRLIPEVVVHLGAEIAAGLHAAHEATDRSGRPLELVHRDVTPSNVLLSYDGHVKLIDFGVARANFRTQETEATSLKGKIAYMSPEQAGGEALDRRTDVYALGLVLWEMLTMRRAFQGANEIHLLSKVRDPKLPPPSALAPVDPALDAVIQRALSVDPDDRYPTMLAFRRALLTACPGALETDSNTLSDLLAVLMKDYRARQDRAIPSEVGLDTSVTIERSGERIGERLRNLMEEDRTIAGTWIDSADIEAAASEVRQIAESPTRVMAPEALTTAMTTEAFEPSGPPLPPPATGSVVVTRGRLVGAFALAALLGLGLGAIALQIVVAGGAEEPEVVIEASPLPAVTPSTGVEAETGSDSETGSESGSETEAASDSDSDSESESESESEAESGSASDSESDSASGSGSETASESDSEIDAESEPDAESPRSLSAAEERRARRERWLERRRRMRERSGGRSGGGDLPLATDL